MVNFLNNRPMGPNEPSLRGKESCATSHKNEEKVDPADPQTPDVGPSHPSDFCLDQELSELYRTTARQLFRYGLLLSRNVGLVEDAVQETFLKFHVQREQRGAIQDQKAWLFRVLHNYILDQQKSHSTKMSVDLKAAYECADKAQSPERVFQYSEAMRLALALLSPREMQCLQLRAEGFSYKEIAGILVIEPGTVGALLTRSSEKIRRAFGKEGLPCEAL